MYSNNRKNDWTEDLISKLNKKKKSIGENAFEGTQITSLDIPKSVKNLGNNAFAECTNLHCVSYEGINEITCLEEVFNTNLDITINVNNQYSSTYNKFCNKAVTKNIEYCNKECFGVKVKSKVNEENCVQCDSSCKCYENNICEICLDDSY